MARVKRAHPNSPLTTHLSQLTTDNWHMTNKVAIYGNRRQGPYLQALAEMFSHLSGLGFKVSVHSKFAGYLIDNNIDLFGAEVIDELPDDTGLVISIGGDGTFLRAARWVGKRETPILGVNTGHLGFLASCRLEEVGTMLGAICRGDVIIEKRMMLWVQSRGLPDGSWHYALNEVALLKEETSSMITVKTEINGRFLANYRCDGLIVSTPTGSTGYNLSAGGPILEPTIDCMTLSPVAPHTLTVRPLVVGGDSELELSVESRTGQFRLSLDDQSYLVCAGESVRVKRAGFVTNLVRRKDSTFSAILRDKLFWNRNNFEF